MITPEKLQTGEKPLDSGEASIYVLVFISLLCEFTVSWFFFPALEPVLEDAGSETRQGDVVDLCVPVESVS